MTLNLCKNLIGVGFVGLHLALLAWLWGRPMFTVPLASWGWLGLSGLVGIAVGDTFFFRSLQILGPRRALLLSTTAPLFAVAFGWLWLAEALAVLSLVGIVVTLSGVMAVVADRKANAESPGLMPGTMTRGVVCGALGASCQAIGGVLSKIGMTTDSGDCDPLEATFIRIFFAAVVSVTYLAIARTLKQSLLESKRWEMLKLLLPATAIGTWIGIWLSQIAFRHTEVAIAQTMMSTCPLFAIPLLWVLYRTRVNYLGVIGTAVALLGIFLTMMNQTSN